MKIVMENNKKVVFGCDFEKIVPTQIEVGFNNDLPTVSSNFSYLLDFY